LILLKGFINNNLIWVCQQWTALSAQSCHSSGMNFSEANNRKRPILLKNSVFQANEKFSTLQAH